MKRTFIRFMGCFVSMFSVFFNGRNSVQAVTLNLENSYCDTFMRNVIVKVESSGPSNYWGCIALTNGSSVGGGKLSCDSSNSGIAEYIDSNYDSDSDNSNGWNNCASGHTLGNQNQSRAWGCFCNGTGLCAPTGYLKSKGYSAATVTSGIVAYNAGSYYTMEQWAAGISAGTGTASGSGTTTTTGTTGIWGGAADYGNINFWPANNESVYQLAYPVEEVIYTVYGCAEGGYYMSSVGVSSFTATLTSLMQNDSYMDSSIAAIACLGTPGYSGTGIVSAYSGLSASCSVCPEVTSGNISDYSSGFISGTKYTSGTSCKADVTIEDDTGTFDVSGCSYSAS